MHIIIGLFLLYLMLRAIFHKEGGSFEPAGMKLSDDGSNTNYDFMYNLKCPYCKTTLSLPQEGNWTCSSCDNRFVFYKNQIYKSEDINSIISIYIVAILAKFCKAEGTVTRKKLNIVEVNIKNYIAVNDIQMNNLKTIFNTEVKNIGNVEDFIEKLHDIVKIDADIKKDIGIFLVDTMFQLSYSSRSLENIDEKLNQIIFKVVQIFNMDITTFDQIKYNYMNDRYSHENYSRQNTSKDMDYYYKVLQCDPNASPEEIRKQYRILCKKFHPDIYASKDLPQEIIDLASEKFREINEAYEYLTNSMK